MRSTAGRRDLTLGEAFITAFGGVRAPIGVPNLDLYGTVGARNFFSSTKITVTGPFGLFSGSESVRKDWVMPVAGFAAHYRFDNRWFMNMLADLGGWSDSATGQALASVGYNWTQNIATTLGYRVMYTYTHQDTGFNDDHFPAEELPLPAVDVRTLRRLQIWFLAAVSPLTRPRRRGSRARETRPARTRR